ncbi:glycosyltransferase family 2 protein [Salinibacter ruber]|uniref:glycosyltransferase family 2 protein n=1 Tax=Salinibacter ruber TaxID=146919 RepID=UPI00161EAD10|nr:glycosyltransferase family 2 protein [Salinibacter ruber]MBB4062108.1 glycosyltransferase involved in cell wall biosynthesis [Salinibacter ruber]
MRNARKIPSPSRESEGWPWTERGKPVPETHPDGDSWPKISVVTPSYNQGAFIEQTIRSVLLQGYPNLEYIVIDGGSDDESVEIIRKYEDWIDYWVSEADRGQSHAINKGFAQASGDIYAWLNSDDYYLPDTLRLFGEAVNESPEAVLWAGACLEVDPDGEPRQHLPPRNLDTSDLQRAVADWWEVAFFHQPASCMSAEAFHRVGEVDEELRFAMDVDLWIRLANEGDFIALEDTVAHANMHEGIKSWTDQDLREAEMIAVAIKNDLPEVARERLTRFADDRFEGAPYEEVLKLIWRRLKKKVLSTVGIG